MRPGRRLTEIDARAQRLAQIDADAEEGELQRRSAANVEAQPLSSSSVAPSSRSTLS
jgi:hypothetical protein